MLGTKTFTFEEIAWRLLVLIHRHRCRLDPDSDGELIITPIRDYKNMGESQLLEAALRSIKKIAEAE